MKQTAQPLSQCSAPLADALRDMCEQRYIPFDVPGHKARSAEMAAYFGEKCLSLDFNSRKDIDNLNQPGGVILQAEQLAARAFGATHALFMVGGTTSAVQAMIMSMCSQGDKIIMPRNAHVSAFNAVILSGAIPVYINPGIHPKLGISLGTSLAQVEACIKANTDAAAVLVNNPTYYGACSDLRAIVELAHCYGIPVLVDEAHGTHFGFSSALPASAMECGADMAAVSMHKTGGSLTQSSLLLVGEQVDVERVRSTVNLFCTTSASYLLMASLDIARRDLVAQGATGQEHALALAKWARDSINAMDGYYAFGYDIIDGESVCDFDGTKLCVNPTKMGLAGIELYTILRDEYHIQVEFGDVNSVLAIVTYADDVASVHALIDALADIRRRYAQAERSQVHYEYLAPIIRIPPRKAFYMRSERIPLDSCVGRISSDYVMCYPPGVPILAPGEWISEEVLAHIRYAAEKGCRITGLFHDDRLEIKVIL